MALTLKEEANGKILVVQASGKLAKVDYEQFVPETERLIRKFGKIRVLFELHDFHGWEAGALWADIKFDLKHFKDIEKLAMVGDKKWEKGMSVFCKPFTTAKIRYFDISRIKDARAWLKGD